MLCVVGIAPEYPERSWKEGMRAESTKASCLKLGHSLDTLKVASFEGEEQ